MTRSTVILGVVPTRTCIPPLAHVPAREIGGQRTSGSRRSLAFNLLIRFQNRGGMRISEEDRTSEEDSQPDGGPGGGRGVTVGDACADACWRGTAIGEGDTND